MSEAKAYDRAMESKQAIRVELRDKRLNSLLQQSLLAVYMSQNER